MEAASYLAGVVIGVAGSTVGNLIVNNDYEKDTDYRVAQVQEYNQQIRELLSPSHKIIAKLILDDGKQKYSFRTENSDHQSEECNGKYVIDKGAAKIAGNLACTIVEPIK